MHPGLDTEASFIPLPLKFENHASIVALAVVTISNLKVEFVGIDPGHAAPQHLVNSLPTSLHKDDDHPQDRRASECPQRCHSVSPLTRRQGGRSAVQMARIAVTLAAQLVAGKPRCARRGPAW